jgi:hypothetical protein
VLIYIRNIFGGFSFLCCCIQILDFLSFHHLFGPWAIIISSLIIDTGKFLTVLMLFEVGFSMLIIAMNQAYYAQAQLSEDINKILDLNEGEFFYLVFREEFLMRIKFRSLPSRHECYDLKNFFPNFFTK